MKQSTTIIFINRGREIHELFSCNELLPNIFVGMCIWIDGRMYRIIDIATIAVEGRVSQHIEVENHHGTDEK